LQGTDCKAYWFELRLAAWLASHTGGICRTFFLLTLRSSLRGG
jgi:hypothetical protein